MPTDRKERLLQLMQKENLIGVDVKIISHEVKTLLLSACWGIGATKDFIVGTEINDYYLHALRATALDVFRNYENVQEIIVVDRAPNFGEKGFTTTFPLNAHFKRQPVHS